jgi:phosphatidylserine/phosphatidylglycerophosphate/cardiolipin synthase-like enzyme
VGHYADVYFSPDRDALQNILGFIERTEQQLDVAVYSITHDTIAQALIDAHNRGVHIRVLIDKAQAGNRYADDEKLEEAGIELRRDRQSGLMHLKMAISDGKAVGLGSFNWTAGAVERNREVWQVTRLSYIVRDCQANFEEVWAANAPT